MRSPPPLRWSAASSCEDIGDSSAYWVPTLFAGGRAARPLVGVGYYVRRTSKPVRAFPGGLVMIAGNQNAKRHSRSPWSAGAAAASALRPGRPSCRTARRTGRCTCGRRSRAAGTAATSTASTTSVTWPTRRTGAARARTRLRRRSSSSSCTPRPRRPPAPGVRALRRTCRLHERLEPGHARGAGGGAQLTRYNARPRGYSSAGRAPGSHPGGRRFEPAQAPPRKAPAQALSA